MRWTQSLEGGFRTRRRLVAVVGVAIVALVAAAGAVLASDGSSSVVSLSQDDKLALVAVISEWNQEKSVPWPADVSVTKLSTDKATELNEAFSDLVAQVGTEEFVAANDSRDVASDEEYKRREAPDSVCLAHEAKVVALEPVAMLASGDIVLRAMVWQGWTTGLVDLETGKVVQEFTIDQTPVHMYVVRKTKAGWRLVAEYRYYQESTDGDRTQYGPDTPHKVDPPIAEWHLD